MKKRMNVLKFTLGLSVFLLVGVKAAVAGNALGYLLLSNFGTLYRYWG